VGRQLEVVQEDVGGVGATTHFIAAQCNNRGGNAAGLCMHGKRRI
jgi:hypothetical protein